MLAITALISSNIPVKASAGNGLEKSIEEFSLTDQKESEDISYMLGKGTDLYVGSVKINALDSKTINVYGSTVAHHKCESISLYIYVEQYNDGSWDSYKSYKYTEDNQSILSKSVNLKVEPGHYYRLRGYHRTYNEGRQESTSTDTKGVYVG